MSLLALGAPPSSSAVSPLYAVVPYYNSTALYYADLSTLPGSLTWQTANTSKINANVRAEFNGVCGTDFPGHAIVYGGTSSIYYQMVDFTDPANPVGKGTAKTVSGISSVASAAYMQPVWYRKDGSAYGGFFHSAGPQNDVVSGYAYDTSTGVGSVYIVTGPDDARAGVVREYGSDYRYIFPEEDDRDLVSDLWTNTFYNASFSPDRTIITNDNPAMMFDRKPLDPTDEVAFVCMGGSGDSLKSYLLPADNSSETAYSDYIPGVGAGYEVSFGVCDDLGERAFILCKNGEFHGIDVSGATPAMSAIADVDIGLGTDYGRMFYIGNDLVLVFKGQAGLGVNLVDVGGPTYSFTDLGRVDPVSSGACYGAAMIY